MFGYIRRHWRGELPLSESFGIDGVLVSLVALLYFFIFAPRVESQVIRSSTASVLAALASISLVPLLLYLPVFVWQVVGLWRGAGRILAQGESFWPWAARIAVLAAVALFGFGLRGSLPLYYSAWRSYETDSAARFKIVNHGSYVVFSGTITESSADELGRQLALPATQRLIIGGSNGGFIEPALRLARIIHQRKLLVVAIGGCYSSCTGLVAAGATRAILPDTVMGFHIGTLAGLDETAKDWAGIDDYYSADGMSQTMLDEIHAHRGTNDLYYPTIAELVENGVVNQIYDPSLHQYVSARGWCDRYVDACARTGRQNRDREKKT